MREGPPGCIPIIIIFHVNPGQIRLTSAAMASPHRPVLEAAEVTRAVLGRELVLELTHRGPARRHRHQDHYQNWQHVVVTSEGSIAVLLMFTRRVGRVAPNRSIDTVPVRRFTPAAFGGG